MESDVAPSHGPHHDAALLAALETTVAPALFAHKMAGEALRVWVPGCATGETAYAVAIVFCAHAEWVDNLPAIQIFATDSDANAIATARQGRYPMTLASTFSPERLSRFFHKNQQHYQITKTARDLVIFAQHQVLRDPPFAHLDLIVCRNLLTTFSLDAQAQLLHLFHWALRPHGYLVLGAMEDRASLSDLFTSLDAAPGLFQRRDVPAKKTLLPGQTAPMDNHLPITVGWYRDGVTIASMRELQTANEQQQALNEELETSQEQLWAANEQLQASNHVLRRKVGELAQANNDLNNLMGATDIATIFLDRALQITRFTPQAQQLFNLISTDRGRPLAHITHTLDYQQLLSDAANVLATLQRVEREVRGADGRWYLARLHPYRTDDERIDGVVLTYVDITARRLAEEAVRDARDELELRVIQRTEELATANRQLQAEIAERTQLEQGRQELLRKLVTMQEDERRRIARELHDQLGQSVSAFGMGLMMLANPSVDAVQHQQTVARLQEITVQIDQDLNRLAFELRPSALDDLGLVAAVQHHVEQWAARTGIRAEFQTSGLHAARLPSEVESVIYRVIQEALTNVLKHAAAQAVSVVLERRHDQVHVIVEDDGRGFDLDALMQAPEAHQRLGLLGMQERVALVGGKLTIEAALGAGTALFIRIPVAPQVSQEQTHA